MVTSVSRLHAGRTSLSSRVSFELPDDADVVSATASLQITSANGRCPNDKEYAQWVERHPHAVLSFEKIITPAQGKRLAVFLDYDGTLTPIVRNPDRAYMSEEMRQTVRAVAELFPTAIISGRGREKVQGFVKLEELYYAGSHGLDIVAPANGHGNGSLRGFQPAAEFEPLIVAVRDQLCDAVKGIEGATVEDNKFCVSVHFRNCMESSWEALKLAVERIVGQHPQLKITRGRKVLEVRPKVDWDKGRAVQHLLTSLDLDQEDVLPIYVGDDRTDEDAFRLLRNRQCGSGIGVLVSTKVKSTQAHFTLQDPADVLVFLTKLVHWGRADMGSDNAEEM